MLPGQNHMCGISKHRVHKIRFNPTVKHGLAGGVGPAKLIADILDSAGYHGTLARHVVPEVR